MLTSHIIRVAVEAALAEDAPYGDITCETTIPADETGSAHLTARENGVMSGIDVFAAAFAAQNPAVTVTAAIKDGERFQRGQILATVKGPVRDLLTAERIALNFTQRMSGIATMTAAFVDAVNAIYSDNYDGSVTRPHRYERTRIVDTRKTTPLAPVREVCRGLRWRPQPSLRTVRCGHDEGQSSGGARRTWYRPDRCHSSRARTGRPHHAY